PGRGETGAAARRLADGATRPAQRANAPARAAPPGGEALGSAPRPGPRQARPHLPRPSLPKGRDQLTARTARLRRRGVACLRDAVERRPARVLARASRRAYPAALSRTPSIQ